MNAQDEIQNLHTNQQNINRLNRRIQLDLLNEFKNYQWMDDWMPASVPTMPTPGDKELQTTMGECLFAFPYALTLNSKSTGKRVWFSVYDDGQYLVQKVLSFAQSTNAKFRDVVMDAYLDWVRNGRSSLWNPDVFLQKISQYTYFNWSAVPCFDMTDETDWPPAARSWADLYLQEILQPDDSVCFSAYPEFSFSADAAASFLRLNGALMAPEYLNPRSLMREMRKGRFLSLGLPAVSFAQAVCGQMIPSLLRAEGLLIPDKMVLWAQDLDERVVNEVSQNIRPSADSLAASLLLRRLGNSVIWTDQYNFGIVQGLVPRPDVTPPALQPINYPPGALQAAHERLVAFFTLIVSRHVNAEAFAHNRAISAQTEAMRSNTNSS
ncbi:hypothetical protein KCU65_g3035, partial [Aureobasidium melanogenum]